MCIFNTHVLFYCYYLQQSIWGDRLKYMNRSNVGKMDRLDKNECVCSLEYICSYASLGLVHKREECIAAFI